jgi:hypothetical protein
MEQDKLAQLVKEENRRKMNTQTEIELKQQQIISMKNEAAKLKTRSELEQTANETEKKENVTLSFSPDTV